MKIKDKEIKVGKVLDMIDARLEMVTMKYNYAKADNNKINAEALAETKWQIAELKMQIADFVFESIGL